MNVLYANQQDDSDPINGTVIAESVQLLALLESKRKNAPFFARFSGDNGFEIMVGIGGEVGCVQYSRSDGKRPYLMAVSADPPMRNGYVEFLAADTPTPCAARYIIRFDEVKKVALYFLQTGERSDTVSWQALNPRAIREDAERSGHA
jgi:hypothetical protein